MSDVTAQDAQERNQNQGSSNNNNKNAKPGPPLSSLKLSEETLKTNNDASARTTSPVNRASNTSPLSQASSTRMSHNPYAAPRSPLSMSPSMPNAPGSFDNAYSGTTSPVLSALAPNAFATANHHHNQRNNTGNFFHPPPLPPPMASHFGPGNDASYDGSGPYCSSPVGGAPSHNGGSRPHPSAFSSYVDAPSHRGDRYNSGVSRGGGFTGNNGSRQGALRGTVPNSRGAQQQQSLSPNNSISGYDRELTELVASSKGSSKVATGSAAPHRPTVFSTPTKESASTAVAPPSAESTPSGVKSITREYRNGRPIPSLRGSNPPSQNTSVIAASNATGNNSTIGESGNLDGADSHHQGVQQHQQRRSSTAQSRSLSPTELAMMNIASEITADAEDPPPFRSTLPQPRSLHSTNTYGVTTSKPSATLAEGSATATEDVSSLPDFVVVEVQFRNDRRRERHLMRYPAERLGIQNSEMLQNAFVIVEGDRGVDLGRVTRMDENATNAFLDSLLLVQKRRFARDDPIGPLDDASAVATSATTAAADADDAEEEALYLTDEEESIILNAASSTELKVMSGVLPSDKLNTTCGPMTFLTDEEIALVHDSQTSDRRRRPAAGAGRPSTFYPLHVYDEEQMEDPATASFVNSVLTADHTNRSPTMNTAAVFHHHRNILVRATGYMHQLQRESKGHAPTTDFFVRRVPANSIVSRFCKYPLVLRNATQEEVDEYHTSLVFEEQRALQSAQELASQHLPVCNPSLTVLNGMTMSPGSKPPTFFVEIVDATFQFDKNKLTLWYVSSERVYFVPLLKALNQRYRCRIWMERLPNSSGSGSASPLSHHESSSPYSNNGGASSKPSAGHRTQQQQQSYSQMRENGFHSSSRNNNANNALSQAPRSSGRRGPAPSHSNTQQHQPSSVPSSASRSAAHNNNNNNTLASSGRRPVPVPKTNANPVKRLSFDEE